MGADAVERNAVTIIAAQNGVMVADSWAFSGYVGHPCSYRKIARAPNGALVGAAGKAALALIVRQWALRGADMSALPELPEKDASDEDDTVSILLMKPDGSVWNAGRNMLFYPYVGIGIGIPDAISMVAGALAVGATLIAAVEAAVKHCQFVGGELQIEYLHGS